MEPLENYAIGLVADGAESVAEDDLCETEEAEALSEEDWRTACDLGVKMARAIGDNRESFLAWYRSVTA